MRSLVMSVRTEAAMPIKIKRLRAVAVASVGLGVFSFGSLTLAGSAAAALPLGCSSSGSTVTCMFTAAGEDAFTVPGEVSSVHVVAVGGHGGSCDGSPGGFGASVTADQPVIPGQVLYVEVAGNGGDSSLNGVTDSGPGGSTAAGPAGSRLVGVAAPPICARCRWQPVRWVRVLLSLPVAAGVVESVAALEAPPAPRALQAARSPPVAVVEAVRALRRLVAFAARSPLGATGVVLRVARAGQVR